MTESEMLAKFKQEVFDRAKLIDPQDEEDWFSMAVGFFLALGVEVSRAFELATPASTGNTRVPKNVLESKNA
jgi:hypothetical protein